MRNGVKKLFVFGISNVNLKFSLIILFLSLTPQNVFHLFKLTLKSPFYSTVTDFAKFLGLSMS